MTYLRRFILGNVWFGCALALLFAGAASLLLFPFLEFPWFIGLALAIIGVILTFFAMRYLNRITVRESIEKRKD